MHSYFDVLPLFQVLTAEDLRVGAGFFDVTTFRAGDEILRPGFICRRLYFIHSGLVYSHTSDERILWYEFEGSPFTDIESFCHQKPGRNFIKAAEDGTTLLSIRYENLQKLYNTSHHWAIWGTRLQQHELVRLTKYYEDLRVKDASQRYFDLIESHPQLLQRVPLGHIASYLGITQVSLSRIRAGMQKK